MKREEVLDLYGDLAEELGALTDCVDMLTARIAKLESWRTGAQANITGHGAALDRHTNRLTAVEAKTIYGRVETPVYATVVPTHSEVAASLREFRLALARLERRQGDLRDARQTDTDTVNAHERRLIALEENPADKRWAGGVMARLDKLETANSDLRGVDRRLSERIEESRSRVHTLEIAKTDFEFGLAGHLMRIERLETAAADPGSTMPEALRLAVQYPLRYELWRSGHGPEWDKGTSRDAKLVYSLIVAREDYVGFPPRFADLNGYPNGYHWLIKDAKGRIVAVHVNAHMPQPPTYYPQEVQP